MVGVHLYASWGFLSNPNNETKEISMRATLDIVFIAFPQSLHILSSRWKCNGRRENIGGNNFFQRTCEGVLSRSHAPNTNSLSHDELADYDNLYENQWLA